MPFHLPHFLPYLLNQAAEASSAEFQATYRARYGMLRTEWRVLFHLGLYGNLTAKEICMLASLHKTKVSRAVAALEKKRYLKRETSPQDRRVERLTLSKGGEAVFADLRGVAKAYEARLMADFSAEETEALRRALIRLSEREPAATKPKGLSSLP